MPSLTRSIVLTLQAAAALTLTGLAWAPSPALASPLPIPPHLADYASQPPSTVTNSNSLPPLTAFSAPRHNVSSSDRLASNTSMASRELNSNILSSINVLGNTYQQINQHSAVINELAGQSANVENDAAFRHQASAQVHSFQSSLLSFQAILADLAADKGLANYDSTDDLETLLKDLVNTVKYTLKSIDIMVENIPGLGPTLGPIVYEIKCILDEVLDAVENLVDAVVNAVAPLLRQLIGQATETVCQSGLSFHVAGLCLVLPLR